MAPLPFEPASQPTRHAVPAKAVDVSVAGGLLRVYQVGNGPRSVLGLHGVSDNHLAFRRLAAQLDDSYTFLIPDLRGRGASYGLPGPFSLDRHAADCARILDHFDFAKTVIAGHSMGALIAVRLAVERPKQVCGVVLVDGGIVPRAERRATWPWFQALSFQQLIRRRIVNHEKVVRSLVGPLLDNLRRTFATEEEYFEAWRNHPAFHRFWDQELQERFAYDLLQEGGRFRSRVSADAVRDDFIDALADIRRIAAEFRQLLCPIRLVCATRGLLDQPEPMIPQKVVASWLAIMPRMEAMTVEDVSHTSIMLLNRSVREIAVLIKDLTHC